MYMLALLEVRLAEGWGKVWGALTSAWPGLSNFLNVLAVLFAAAGFLKWIWDRRRNPGQGDNKGLIGALLIAAALAAPDLLFPLMLWLADGVINWLLALAPNR